MYSFDGAGQIIEYGSTWDVPFANNVDWNNVTCDGNPIPIDCHFQELEVYLNDRPDNRRTLWLYAQPTIWTTLFAKKNGVHYYPFDYSGILHTGSYLVDLIPQPGRITDWVPRENRSLVYLSNCCRHAFYHEDGTSAQTPKRPNTMGMVNVSFTGGYGSFGFTHNVSTPYTLDTLPASAPFTAEVVPLHDTSADKDVVGLRLTWKNPGSGQKFGIRAFACMSDIARQCTLAPDNTASWIRHSSIEARMFSTASPESSFSLNHTVILGSAAGTIGMDLKPHEYTVSTNPRTVTYGFPYGGFVGDPDYGYMYDNMSFMYQVYGSGGKTLSRYYLQYLDQTTVYSDHVLLSGVNDNCTIYGPSGVQPETIKYTQIAFGITNTHEMRNTYPMAGITKFAVWVYPVA